MTQSKYEDIYILHRKWLAGDPDGKQARFVGEDLYSLCMNSDDLRKAQFEFVNFMGADLRRADLRGATFFNCNFNGALIANTLFDKETYDELFPLCCPEEGSFIGWKKVYCSCRSTNPRDYFNTSKFHMPVIVKLFIPAHAKRSSAAGRKCRCSEAVVMDIFCKIPEGLERIDDIFFSAFNTNFEYRIGETVKVNNFDNDRTHECAPGIHFFITRKEAENYCY